MSGLIQGRLELTKGRSFQLWEYHVSLGCLLVRSPSGPKFEASIDVIFMGVQYLALPRYLSEIAVLEGSEEEEDAVQRIVKFHRPTRLWVLQNSEHRFPVVALAPVIREHKGGIFESPFHFPNRREDSFVG